MPQIVYHGRLNPVKSHKNIHERFTMAKLGQKTKLNKELLSKLCEIISHGNYIKSACMAVGIGERTYYDWVKRGEDDISHESNTIYAQFVHDTKVAHAQAQTLAVRVISNKIQSGDKDAWIAAMTYLERTAPALFGKRTDMPTIQNQILIDLREKGRMLIESHSDNQPATLNTQDVKLLTNGESP